MKEYFSCEPPKPIHHRFGILKCKTSLILYLIGEVKKKSGNLLWLYEHLKKETYDILIDEPYDWVPERSELLQCEAIRDALQNLLVDMLIDKCNARNFGDFKGMLAIDHWMCEFSHLRNAFLEYLTRFDAPDEPQQ